MSSSLPSTIPVGDNFIQRNDSTETDESPFGSGLTTPVDEDILQPFDQIARLFADIDTTSIHGTPRPKTYSEFKDGSPATPKPRTLSKAVMKAKQFAQGLVQSKKVTNAGPLVLPTPSISLKEIFPNLKPESPFIEAAPMPLVREHATSIYSLPNDSICIEAETNSPILEAILPSQPEPIDLSAPVTYPNSENDSAKDLTGTPGSPSTVQETVSSSDSPDIINNEGLLSQECSNITLKILLSIVGKVIFFLPWCAAVGGTILLFPRHIELVAFVPGYTPSPKGIHRFAHWADCAMHHVMIFLAFVVTVGWWRTSIGILLATGVLAQFVFAWRDFVLDRTVPLGEDDRQTMYLVATNYGLDEDSMNLKRTQAGYLISPAEKDQVTAESDEE